MPKTKLEAQGKEKAVQSDILCSKCGKSLELPSNAFWLNFQKKHPTLHHLNCKQEVK